MRFSCLIHETEYAKIIRHIAVTRAYNNRLTLCQRSFFNQMLHIVSEQLIAKNAFDLDILNAKMLYIVKVHSAFQEGLDKSTHGRNARPRILAKGKKDVFEGNALDRHFGQSIKVACTNLAIDALQISEGERTEIRCALVYGKAFSGVDIFAVAVGVAAVIPHIENDGRQYAYHS